MVRHFDSDYRASHPDPPLGSSAPGKAPTCEPLADAVNFVAVAEIVTPNEVATRLGVTGLAFRNAGSGGRSPTDIPSSLPTSTVPTTRSPEPRLTSSLLSSPHRSSALELTQSIRPRDHSGYAIGAEPRPRPASRTKGPKPGRRRLNFPRSEDPGHRVTTDWMGEEVETSTISYVRSTCGRHRHQSGTEERRRRPLLPGQLWPNILPPSPSGRSDARRRRIRGRPQLCRRHRVHGRRQKARHARQQGLRAGELEHGRGLLEAKIATLDVPLVIFVFKSAADTLLGPLPPYFYGLVPRRRLGEARVFVMPGPTAARTIESDAVRS